MRAHRTAAAVVLLLLVVPTLLHSQELRANARVGTMAHDHAPTGGTATSSLVVGLALLDDRSWLGASAAVPAGVAPRWAVLGGSHRITGRGRAGLLLDLAAHGFLQHDPDGGDPGGPPLAGLPTPLDPSSPDAPDLSGSGVGGEVQLGVRAPAGPLRLEARGGGAVQYSRLAGTARDHALPVADLRVQLPLGPIALGAESRAWFGDNGVHALATATLVYAHPAVQAWASVGRWFRGGVGHTAWGVAGSATVVEGVALQAGGRGRTFDPLYGSLTGTSVWGGVSLRLAGAHGPASTSPRIVRGEAVIRVPAGREADAPSVAGDFSGWAPVRMVREGRSWVHRVSLEPGVYSYAFVSPDGRWYVPDGHPGRKADGMGGHVAVLVVTE